MLPSALPRALAERLANPTGTFARAEAALAIHEAELTLGHTLTEQQREAVVQALSSPVSVLCGAAV